MKNKQIYCQVLEFNCVLIFTIQTVFPWVFLNFIDKRVISLQVLVILQTIYILFDLIR